MGGPERLPRPFRGEKNEIRIFHGLRPGFAGTPPVATAHDPSGVEEAGGIGKASPPVEAAGVKAIADKFGYYESKRDKKELQHGGYEDQGSPFG